MYHCSVKSIGRGGGKSAVGASAYRNAEKIECQETGKIHDYSRKGGVVHSEVMICKNAPLEYSNRATLWNEVHKKESQSNAQLAREVQVALPKEFDRETQIRVVQEYVRENFVNKGMCADIAIHDTGDGNPHAHIMLTTRAIKENGEWDVKERKGYKLDENGEKIAIKDPTTGKQKIGAKNRKMWERETIQANDWNSRDRMEEWRSGWSNACNKYLAKEEQIDHRSFKRQGKELEPTIHEGYVAREIEKRGGTSERCQINREIRKRNSIKEQIQAIGEEIKKYVREFAQPIAKENKEQVDKQPSTAEHLKDKETPPTPVESNRFNWLPFKKKDKKPVVLEEYRPLHDDMREEPGEQGVEVPKNSIQGIETPENEIKYITPSVTMSEKEYDDKLIPLLIENEVKVKEVHKEEPKTKGEPTTYVFELEEKELPKLEKAIEQYNDQNRIDEIGAKEVSDIFEEKSLDMSAWKKEIEAKRENRDNKKEITSPSKGKGYDR